LLIFKDDFVTLCVKQILNMEHKIQHETLHLKEEKQLVREIKQMKNLKDQLYGNAQKQEEIKQALDQKEQVEEHLKVSVTCCSCHSFLCKLILCSF